MRTEHYKLAVTLVSASALLLFNELDAYSYFRRRTPARAPREQDADARVHKTPAQVEGSPPRARRLDGACEGLVNPNMDGPCVDGFPNGWIRHGTNAVGDCVDGGDDEYYDLSNSRPAESIRQELPPGSVWGAVTTIEIIFRVVLATLRGDGWYSSSPEAPVEFYTWFRNPENGEEFFRQLNFNYRHDSNSNEGDIPLR